jgi:hypothetical protein
MKREKICQLRTIPVCIQQVTYNTNTVVTTFNGHLTLQKRKPVLLALDRAQGKAETAFPTHNLFLIVDIKSSRNTHRDDGRFGGLWFQCRLYVEAVHKNIGSWWRTL